jgi:type 1 glutamine amidotransferase
VLFAVIAACAGPDAPPDVVLFSRTTGYRHADAIAAARTVLPARLEREGLHVQATEDPLALEDLTTASVVVFLYTTGDDVLAAAGKAELERFVRGGGGWVGIHSAADTEYAWPFYQELVVAPFASHPDLQVAAVDVVAPGHPVMAPVPTSRWEAEDEWYNFARDASTTAGVEVLANLDEASYVGGTMGVSHPIIWAHARLGGRALYSGIGHVAARWRDAVYLEHVTAAILWAAPP